MFPYIVTRTFSLLDGLSKPTQLAQRAVDLELDAIALTDHGSLAGSVQFIKACKDKKVKPILGCELYLSNFPSNEKSVANRKLFHQVVLAKNLQGWKDLMKLTSDANSAERFYHRPRLDFNYFEEHNQKNLITFSGHLGSHLANVAMTKTKEEVVKAAEYLRDLFGKDNFFIEIQLIDSKVSEEARTVGDILREVGVITGIPCIATADSHYCSQIDAEDQRVLLCTNLRTTLGKVSKAMDNEEEVGLSAFFRSANFHIPSQQEMMKFHTKAEIENTNLIADAVETYDILSKPIFPNFECPKGLNEDEYLRHLCRQGFMLKIKSDNPKYSTYVDRVKHELQVLQGAGLSSYFLVMQDILDFARKSGWLVGPGRGSAAGCLVSYLIDIVAIDPIKYDLIFERFYNAGRNTADRISYPDIDIDVPVYKREAIINYIKGKYGNDKVSHMVTFQTMKGRGALKNVLRAHGNISFNEMNLITEHIPDEAKIADDLQEMREETGESSIIRWALENRADKLREWCYIKEDGTLDGPLSKRFEQAIRLEGTKTSQSKHASGVVVSPVPLPEICPMVIDNNSKDKELIAGMEMFDLEALGIPKLDVLGLNLLDKMMGIQQILEYGDIRQ